MTSESAADLTHLHNALMAALHATINGATLSTTISVPPLGQSLTVEKALSLASQHLDEPFHDEELQTVDAAFRRFRLVRSSDNKAEVARIVFDLLRGNHENV